MNDIPETDELTPTPRTEFRKTLDNSTGVSELLADSNTAYIAWIEKELTAARDTVESLTTTAFDLLTALGNARNERDEARGQRDRLAGR